MLLKVMSLLLLLLLLYFSFSRSITDAGMINGVFNESSYDVGTVDERFKQTEKKIMNKIIFLRNESNKSEMTRCKEN